MNASAVIVSIAIVFVAAIAGGLIAIVGIAAEVVQHLRRLTKRDKTS